MVKTIKKTALYRLFQRLRWRFRARRFQYDNIKIRAGGKAFSMNTRSWQAAPLIVQYGKGDELFYEKEESERFLELIEEGDIVFDIGGQVGYYTLLALQGGAGKVYAFEISRAYRKEIKRQLCLVGLRNKVEIVAAALGEHDGKEVVFQDYFGKTKMRGVTVDTFCKERDISPNVIKIDVQGQEISVLEGIKETLKKHRPRLMVMLYEELLRERGEKKEEGLAIIREAGYEIERFANEHSYICIPNNEPDRTASGAVSGRVRFRDESAPPTRLCPSSSPQSGEVFGQKRNKKYL